MGITLSIELDPNCTSNKLLSRPNFRNIRTQWSTQCMKSKSSSEQSSVVLLFPDTLSLQVSSLSLRLEHLASSPHFSLSTSWWSTGSSSSSWYKKNRREIDVSIIVYLHRELNVRYIPTYLLYLLHILLSCRHFGQDMSRAVAKFVGGHHLET